ncbi:Altronate dehydratase [Fusobacterium sp. DD29]|uniref:UxaA family hydrolase n=1 Tax=unclassified Fusobacterium TaxID=2648384 RepID=UPI001B8D179F|nr:MULTISPECIES: altronate dehydratase family protein [unclassified Fusobacterium]MBR8748609.1 Altronate dehydratase [Fusobacterium sp. DD29]MBR8760927.1 Altronate dehydratase [Fusobacterium sp. DD25]MBR8766939.1 Altronate dehydratase [Fusobacterium sp. DD43]MBR8770889.1 Altronate dehydratase [Fusobacterium sp. DD40]MBR8775164.1 Altronate dehydratase [Fusobacterium sp. DD17]
MKEFIKINELDNVIIALRNFKQNEIIECDNKKIILSEDVDRGHKIAIDDIKEHDNIIKYGLPIGFATKNIQAGEWVHTHNTKTNLKDLNTYEYLPNFIHNEIKRKDIKVKVYKRKNGDVGIRNELWIVPTVGCVNGVAQKIKEAFLKEVKELEIDDINVLTHNYGCSQLGEDHLNTRIILQNTVKHPNAGGVLVLGLGCENNQVSEFKQTMGDYDAERVKFLIAQEVDDEIQAGKEILLELYDKMKSDKREEASINTVNFGLECGGSDGLSGITANPMLGYFSDYIISLGGTTVLTEVPEMFGAETLLMERCENIEVFEKCVNMINNFKEYFLINGQEIYENPSPGNKKGGITTLEDKSLGCTQKSGTSIVVDVLKYGEILKKKGLNLLSAPGNDLIATTALAAAKCHIVLFTTGRGNPYGGYIPTVKISTNTDLYEKKRKWIDFNAGKIVTENMSFQEITKEFIEYIVRVINGEKTNNEKNNFQELAIFKSGITL